MSKDYCRHPPPPSLLRTSSTRYTAAIKFTPAGFLTNLSCRPCTHPSCNNKKKNRLEEERRRREEEERLRWMRETAERRRLVQQHMANLKRQRALEAERNAMAEEEALAIAIMREEKRCMCGVRSLVCSNCVRMLAGVIFNRAISLENDNTHRSQREDTACYSVCV